MYLVGQICGIVGTIITIIQPQFKKKEQILICCILVNTMNALNFALIGQTGSAVFLCLVAIVQSISSIWHERQRTRISPLETTLFFTLYVGFGFYGMITSEDFVWAINRHNLLELLPIIGALLLMLSVFAKGEQRTRLFLLLNGAAWCLYTAIIGAAVFFTTIASMFSTAIAMWKYRTPYVSRQSDQ